MTMIMMMMIDHDEHINHIGGDCGFSFRFDCVVHRSFEGVVGDAEWYAAQRSKWSRVSSVMSFLSSLLLGV